MKRKVFSNNPLYGEAKKTKGSVTAVEVNNVGDMSPPTTKPPDQQQQMDHDDNQIINCETKNRFSVFLINKPESDILRIPPDKKPKTPPKIFVLANKNHTQGLLTQIPTTEYALESVFEGTNILVNDMKQHAALIARFEKEDVKFSTRPPPEGNVKRFVVYGLNSSDEGQIITDLAQYNVTADKVRVIRVKKPRYEDHCNFVVYIKRSERIDLNTLKQVQYLCHTKVKWAYYIANGDGISKCSRCQRFGHPGDFCNLPPRCGICAGHHLTMNCELLALKRANNKTFIDTDLLNCVHCQGKHTAGFMGCQKRINYSSKRQSQNQQKRVEYVDAPAPRKSPWNIQHLPQPQIQPSPKQQQVFSYVNNSFKQPQPASDDQNNINCSNNQGKFTAKEIASIFSHVINCVEKCRTKSEQLQTIVNVISEYYP